MAKRNGKHLVIVESPAKAKTINKYLGDEYVVRASMGHVRDLPTKGGDLGVNLETFEPRYEVLSSRSKVMTELRKLAKDSDEVYLATDLDREGEAIAWHLKEALKIPDARAKRVIFNAITKSEIQKAFASPHQIDTARVNAQQARRILDRIVGWEISPLLWRKVARGLSAGRVQSVAVRLVVEREREIEAFVPREFWRIGGAFSTQTDAVQVGALSEAWREFLTHTQNGERTKAEREKWLADHQAFWAELAELGGQKFEPENKEQAQAAAEALGFVIERVKTTEDAEGKGPAKYVTQMNGRLAGVPQVAVSGVEKKRTTVRPSAPFITSTLQQAAASRLSFGAQRTMRAAQTLYEGGYITYMRTDSTNLSPEALSMARGYIGKEFGDKYLPTKANFYSSSNKSAQEAHEAIRPTDVKLTPQGAAGKLSGDEARLYGVIWSRFVACQMSAAEFDLTNVTLSAQTKKGEAVFKASGRELVFDGFMRVAGVSSSDQLLPELKAKQAVSAIDLNPTQHFTQPPPRFTEASLVKELEKRGIGRPSTYATIIETIQKREYVEQIARRFYATLMGKVVTDKLVEGFPKVMEVGFTADMESKLDQIEEQHLDWVNLLRDFYGPFHQNVEAALEKLEHAGGTPSEYICEKCGGRMLYRISKTGFFLACENRECGHTMAVDTMGKPKVREVSEYTCPVCGRPMIKRKGRFGEFLGCSGYSEKNEQGEPACTMIINLDKNGKPQAPKPKPIHTTVKCEKCGSDMLLRDSKRGPFLGCSTFPKCRSTKMVKKLEGADLEQVEKLLPELEKATRESKVLVEKLLAQHPDQAEEAKAEHVATDIDCSECGKPMVIRHGRRGPFLGCSGYPACHNTAEVPAQLLEQMKLADESEPRARRAKKSADDADSAQIDTAGHEHDE